MSAPVVWDGRLPMTVRLPAVTAALVDRAVRNLTDWQRRLLLTLDFDAGGLLPALTLYLDDLIDQDDVLTPLGTAVRAELLRAQAADGEDLTLADLIALAEDAILTGGESQAR